MRQTEIFRHLDALETIANQYLIPFIASVASALVTLVILAAKGFIKLSYLAYLLNNLFKIKSLDLIQTLIYTLVYLNINQSNNQN